MDIYRSYELYNQFKDIQQRNEQVESEPFSLAQSFESLASAQYKHLIDHNRPLNDTDSYAIRRLRVMFREETNTWRLARSLLRDQILSRGDPFVPCVNPTSDEQRIANLYAIDDNIRRLQIVCDWLEANEMTEIEADGKGIPIDLEAPHAWENTFFAMRTHKSPANISSMDPDAPISSNKSLAHEDRETEIKLLKFLFRYLRAGRLSEGQALASRVGYNWLAAILDGWLPYSQDEEHAEETGNKKRDVWKLTCFKASRMHGMTSYEKAILGVLGGNLKSVLPVCDSWADQLWARLRCSIDVQIEKALRDADSVPQENRNLINYPEEFYDSYQDISNIFKSIDNRKIPSPTQEETIYHVIQRHLILNNLNGLLEQLKDWCSVLEYEDNLAENREAISPHFLRFFAHLVLFLGQINLVGTDDSRGTAIVESYISQLIQQKSIESVAYYANSLPHNNQVRSYAKLLATISEPEERKRCLEIAITHKLDIDEITQTVVEFILEEPSEQTPANPDFTKTSQSDRRKIDSLDYLLYPEPKNYLAILHRGNALLRYFALQKKDEALKQVFLKLPMNLMRLVEEQWHELTGKDKTPSLKNNIRELEGFSLLLGAQENLAQWSEWHRSKPEEPKKPANLSKFCDNVNYEQSLKQYQADLNLWEQLREVRTNALVNKMEELCLFQDGWMVDLPAKDDRNVNQAQRLEQLAELRKVYIPQMITICFNVLYLTNRYDDCLKISHLLADESLGLYHEFTKVQIRDYLDKISEVTKVMVKNQ